MPYPLLSIKVKTNLRIYIDKRLDKSFILDLYKLT